MEDLKDKLDKIYLEVDRHYYSGVIEPFAGKELLKQIKDVIIDIEQIIHNDKIQKEYIHIRLKKGIEKAKKQGKYKGRKKGAITNIKEKKSNLLNDIQLKINKGMSLSKIARTTEGVTRITIYNYLKKGLLQRAN